ncbi:hypothetical protein F3N42_03365 [Marinihelvus fidelis]|uniref:Uncharacterized protein n=1 Tax=Marinihelvus fidelis TaxID=2613842 RepID=A0A5N0TFK6_9GAMM|nr:hypothetical protein [Marinihelvus fidelis]KAA9133401.1 hypothetical protein F3N42_03365 [Marinihelvus fidelis]
MRSLVAFTGLMLPVMISFTAANSRLDDRVALAEPASDAALHQQIIDRLKLDDSVIPWTPDRYGPRVTYNREAVIPPQCYTRTEGVFNPCYVCHQAEVEGHENRMNDGHLQRAYSFSEQGMTNHWANLFEDRSERVAAISDEEILDWIAEDNYSALPERLRQAEFRGWVPDLDNLQRGAAAFDDEGFALDGSDWVAFNYKPMPSTFWPTNGSTDDVMIRLPEPFRRTADGAPSRDVYRANLAILEANIKALDEIDVRPVDESVVGVDLDGDGLLGRARRIVAMDQWVGQASDWYKATHLYPLETEFLHTVRYVGFDAEGRIAPSTRMKEVRYMRKLYVMPKFGLYNAYLEEGYAKDQGYMPGYISMGPNGLANEMGWVLQGFIEGVSGQLRAATYEENLFCMGCHSSIGSTTDKVFSFARKVDGAEGWGYINLAGMPDAPNHGETRGEYEVYLERVGGGGEFRSNPEMQDRFFNKAGELDIASVRAAGDVYGLITPSRERALVLNKAYRVIVADQDFVFGRDATVTPPVNVLENVDNEAATTLPDERVFEWDMRLDWRNRAASGSAVTSASP